MDVDKTLVNHTQGVESHPFLQTSARQAKHLPANYGK